MGLTSAFQDSGDLRTISNLQRRFLIGTSDYTTRVLRWPSITRKWDDPRPATVTIELANQDGHFVLFVDTPTNLRGSANVDANTTGGASDWVRYISGTISNVKFNDGRCSLQITDKFRELTEKRIGTRDNPVEFITSDYILSDLALWIVSSYGGYDGTTGTGNTDIDWATFSEWHGAKVDNSVRVQAKFTGETVLEALRQINMIDDTAIYYTPNNKIAFRNFSYDSVDRPAVNYDTARMSVALNDQDVVNRYTMPGSYDVDANSWGWGVTVANTASVNSFGERTKDLQPKSIWYVTSESAIGLAERKLAVRGLPYLEVGVQGAMNFAGWLVGDTCVVSDALLGIGGQFWIREHTIDLHSFKTRMKVDKGLNLSPFTLDVSELDGPDALV